MYDARKETPAPGVGFGVSDVYYVLFRHKWKILTCWALGLVAAVLVFFLFPPPYVSGARLLIRYVLDNRATATAEADAQVRLPDVRGETILVSQMEILTSRDVMERAASIFGPEKILAKVGGGTNLTEAAGYLSRNFSIAPPRKSSVIAMTLQHPDPEVVRPALAAIIEAYLRKHFEVHRSAGGLDDYLTRETGELESKLNQTEKLLRELKAKAGVVDVADSRKAFSAQMTKIQEELLSAEVELAARRGAMGLAATTAGSKDGPPPPPTEMVEDYRALLSRLATARKRESDLMLTATDENTTLKAIRGQITAFRQEKKKLEEQHPGLTNITVPTLELKGVPSDPMLDQAQLASLQERIKALSAQLARMQTNVVAFDEAAIEILKLDRQRELQETNYRTAVIARDAARAEERGGPGHITNISHVEAPTPPSYNLKEQIKRVGMAFGGGLGLGLALAFLLELVLDRTVKRPVEIESKLRLPLFLSIPLLRERKAKRRAAPKPEVPPPSPEVSPATGGPPAELAPTEAVPSAVQVPVPATGNGALRPFFEALRDRVAVHLERISHKPKLVAVTGCSPGSGVTTLAAGLAASLSETGDGKVLLVDMNLEHGAVHPFFRGQPSCGLLEALEKDKGQKGQVQQNLVLAAASSGNGHGGSLVPRKFANLMPKLVATDYDFVIFDMPPVSQTSVTPRLARLMDMTLMVIESEKTQVDVVRQASALLQQSKADVAVVLNKTRSYVPRRLLQEL